MAHTVCKGVRFSIGDPNASLFTIDLTADLTSARETAGSFRQFCRKDGHAPAGVKQRLACPVCDNDDATTFESAKPLGQNNFAVVSSEIKAAAADAAAALKGRAVITPHPLADVTATTLPADKVYFLQPGPHEQGRYLLIRDILLDNPELAFVCALTVRSSASLFRLVVHHGALAIVELTRPHMVREAPQAVGEYNPALREAAASLLPTLAQPFEPDAYLDQAQVTLTSSLEDAEVVVLDADKVPAAPASSQSDDGLLVDLTKALEAARAAKEPAPKKRAPRKAAVKAAS